MTQKEALSILKTGANVFLTGEPGSGKTHTVNAYVAWLRQHDIEPAVTASTGIAATHIGGFTVHSWSGIGVRRELSKYDLDAIAQNRNVSRRVRSAHVLIIDEVSMLSARTLGMVEAVCREVRNSVRPFGGLQVVLVGDFFQLPPVVPQNEPQHSAQQSFAPGTDRERFAFAASAWERAKFIECYLSEQHRQEDAAFLSFLSAVRCGSVSEKHRALLRTRYAPKPKAGMTQLYAHNTDVDALNDAELAKLPGRAATFDMETRGSEKLVAGLKRGCLSPEKLALKVGARVMFTKNDAARHRYVNGTLGVVAGFVGGAGYPIIETRSGREVIAEPDEWRIEDNGRVLARITQVPLRLAWAMTVHKSQGMSLDAAHMDLAGAFEYGQGYVALSRVRTLQGLTLAGLNARALEVHPDVLEKDAAFRAASDAARQAFADMPEAERAQMEANFVKACGGRPASAPSKQKEKEPVAEKETRSDTGRTNKSTRWEHTLALVRRGMSLEEVAKARGRTTGTIFKHLEQLSAMGALDGASLAHLGAGKEKDITRAAAAFRSTKPAYLKLVFEKLNGEVPYETIRLARLLGGFPLPPKQSRETEA